jgi:hypothetical protein
MNGTIRKKPVWKQVLGVSSHLFTFLVSVQIPALDRALGQHQC